MYMKLVAKLRQRKQRFLEIRMCKAERKKILFRLASRMLQSLGMISGILEEDGTKLWF